MHDRFTMLMSASLDGETTAEEQQLLEEHLRTCSVCAATWERWRRVHRLFASAPPVTPSGDYAGAVLGRLGQRRLHRGR